VRSLFISPWAPHPLNTGGNQRIFHLLEAISKVSEVTFVSAMQGGSWAGPPAAFQSLCRDMFFFPDETIGWNSDLQRPAPIRKFRSMLRHLNPKPLLWQWYTSSEGIRLLKRLSARHFDVIWAQRLISLNLLPAWLEARVIVDLDDLEHQKLCRQMNLSKANRFSLQYLEFLKLRRLELNLRRLPHEFVVCSEMDRAALNAGSNVSVIPNGIEIPPSVEDSALACPLPVLLFVGSMSYRPNIDAVQFFCREVLPFVRREVPEAKCVIVGQNPSADVLALHDRNSVVVTGTVPSVEPYMREATAVVAPIRIGGGTRIKILEAMAYRRPVVSTSIGAEGLEVETEKHLLIANSAVDFANACIRLLRAPNIRRDLATNAFELVSAKYDWSKIQAKVMQMVLQQGTDSHLRTDGTRSVERSA
jgi:glycosyltransferase involved in cell wall biosynthesis